MGNVSTLLGVTKELASRDSVAHLYVCLRTRRFRWSVLRVDIVIKVYLAALHLAVSVLRPYTHEYILVNANGRARWATSCPHEYARRGRAP